jgi:type III secretory pathway component EscT
LNSKQKLIKKIPLKLPAGLYHFSFEIPFKAEKPERTYAFSPDGLKEYRILAGRELIIGVLIGILITALCILLL